MRSANQNSCSPVDC